MSNTTDADTLRDRPCQSTLLWRRRAQSSPRRTPVVAATRIARAYSGRRDDAAAATRRRTSSGVGTTGATLGRDGGSAHCAGVVSRQPHRHACANMEDAHAWIW